jgi:predicted alpha-1,2-mannosidase
MLGATDTQRALTDLLHQANTLPPAWPREHLDAYLKYGYVPYDIDHIGPSVTEEYNTDDYAVAQLAAALGDSTDATALATRSGYWHNLVDPANHFIQPRNSDGSWATPSHSSNPGFSGLDTSALPLPYSPVFQDGYQEATGWQDLWGVPHDVAGLAQAIGGTQVTLHRLDRFFSTALNQPLAPAVPLAQQEISFFGVYYIGNQYTPVNEPDLWAPWYYDWLGQPWKTQKVARAESETYNQTPQGLPGNDDTGEMAGWYVLQALGIYRAAPGVDAWELSSPMFPKARINQGSSQLTIEAPGASNAKPYVHALTLNGSPVNRTFLTTCQLRSGGALNFSLGVLPDHKWGTGPGAAPPSDSAPSADVDSCTASLAGSGPA